MCVHIYSYDILKEELPTFEKNIIFTKIYKSIINTNIIWKITTVLLYAYYMLN